MEGVRKLSPAVLILIAFLIPVNQIVGNYLLKIHFFTPIAEATNYWIQPTLVGNLISLAVFSFIIFVVGKHDLRSVWLTPEKLKSAALLIFAIWFLSQLVAILGTYFSTGNIVFVDRINVLAGYLLGQLFGNAAFEELIYRGIFFLQIYILLKNSLSINKALVLSILLSQILFALIHIPNRLMVNQVENLGLNLFGLFVMGVVLAIIYFRTKNLAFLIGVHALLNEPFNLIQTSFPMKRIVLILVILVTILWTNKTVLRLLSGLERSGSNYQ